VEGTRIAFRLARSDLDRGTQGSTAGTPVRTGARPPAAESHRGSMR